jgi:DNA-binding CsgD family transcriptional regulator
MHPALTKYQDRIMDLLITGMTPKEIAYELQRSEPAVRMAMLEIKHKLRARTLAQAVSLYVNGKNNYAKCLAQDTE